MKEKEIWKDISEYEGYYQVSTMGRIRSVDREVVYSDGRVRFHKGLIKKLRLERNNVLQVNLNKNGNDRRYNVHNLVMLTFVGERPEGYDICHENGDATDNRLDNLRYDTRSQNQIDIYRHGNKKSNGKLSIEQVLEIRKLYATGDYKQRELSEMFGVSNISRIVTRSYFGWLNDDGTIDESNTAVS